MLPFSKMHGEVRAARNSGQDRAGHTDRGGSIMDTPVTFTSDGLTLAGDLHIPDSHRPGERLPAFIVLHGFIGSKDKSHAELMARMLEGFGYAVLRFDFRGCGKSEGKRGYVLCHDQVADAKNALNWLSERPEVDPRRIAVIGHSFGAAVACYAGAVDQRFAAVVSSCGWGHGERKFRGQHPGAEAWARFTGMLEANREHKEKTGEALTVPRFDVVPMQEHLRKNLSPNALMEVSADTAQSMFDFRAEEVVHWISPRPVLFIHGADDTVTPTEQSIRLWEKAGQPKDLVLITGTDHFPLAGNNARTKGLLKGWLDVHFPAPAP
jgi:alpha/beta superfamily hydrolase